MVIAVISKLVGLHTRIVSLLSLSSARRTVPSRNPATRASSLGRAHTQVAIRLLEVATQSGLRPIGPSLPSKGQQIALLEPDVTRCGVLPAHEKLFTFVGYPVIARLVLSLSRHPCSAFSCIADATSAGRLILAGVAVSFIIMGAANMLIFLGDPRASHTVVFWMLGGLGLAQWSQLVYPFIIISVCGVWLLGRANVLNAMTLGDETASTLGISVTKFRLSVFVVGALITGVMVAFSGIIGFVGLMVPHIARMAVGGDYARILLASALVGAILLLWADIAARTLMAPEDMPIGIVTGLVGGVFFVWLLGRRKA